MKAGRFLFPRTNFLEIDTDCQPPQRFSFPDHFLKEQAVPDFNQLTDRQREIYEFIRQKIEGRGYGPTVREIGQAFDIKSPNGVMCHLKALEKKGLIKREGFSARAIQLIDHRPGSAGLPMLGVVAAGSPVLAHAQNETVEFG